MGNHLYGEAGRQVHDFVWSELCDWYIEAAKVRLRGTPVERQAVAQTLAFALERSVRLLHPYMPFVTEALWQELPHVGDSVMVAPWPVAGDRDRDAEADFEALMELVRGIRNARTEAGVEPGRWIAADVTVGARRAAFEESRRELSALARIDDDRLRIAREALEASEEAIVVVARDASASLPLAGLVDLHAERERLGRELAEAEAEVTRAESQLANEAFVARAPAPVVEAQRKRRSLAAEQVAVLRSRLDALGG